MFDPCNGIDWDAVKKQEDIERLQKTLDEILNNQNLQIRISSLISRSYTGEALTTAKLQEGAIIKFIHDNISDKAIKEDSSLLRIIDTYLKVLTDSEINVSRYLFLLANSKTKDNELLRVLQTKYSESEATLMEQSPLFEIDSANTPDKILDQVLFQYEDGRIRGRIYCEITSKYKNYGKDKDLIVGTMIKRLEEAYRTVVTIKSSDLYEVINPSQERTLIYHGNR